MTTRVASIESFRVLAIFAVILSHTGFVTDLSQLAGESLAVVLTGYLVWWVGVPYFFITAGYFFRQSVLQDNNPIAQLRRYVAPLVWIFIGWMCLYIVVPPNWPGEVLHHGLWQTFYSTALKNVQLITTDHIKLILMGHRPIYHLWFLPALVFSLAALTFVAIYRLQRYLIHIVVCLYVLALTDEILGMHFSNSGLYVGTWSIALLFTVVGWLLAEREQPSATAAWSLVISGYVFAIMEGAIMSAIFHIPSQDLRWHFFLGGIVLGIGIFLLSLARPTFGQYTPLPFLARFTLGVYVSHILVLYTLSPLLWRFHLPLRGFFVGIVVYIFSVLLTIVIARVPLVSHLVMKPARHDVSGNQIHLNANA